MTGLAADLAIVFTKQSVPDSTYTEFRFTVSADGDERKQNVPLVVGQFKSISDRLQVPMLHRYRNFDRELAGVH